jgi:hypothetical protein
MFKTNTEADAWVWYFLARVRKDRFRGVKKAKGAIAFLGKQSMMRV